MINDTIFMRRCFQLARLGRATVRGNPMVGAVIVHGGRIIGEGWHRSYGGPHAEVEALASVAAADKELLTESTLYVSLEPCSHYGKTPPCSDLILQAGIPNVKISCLDVNPLVTGRGLRRLQENGLRVEAAILEDEGHHLIRRFRTFHLQKRPYIILKWAQSSDGYIGRVGEQIWLTSPLARWLSHQWRTEEMAIMVGTNTALVDNPRLTSRLHLGGQPLRVVLDATHRIPSSHHLLCDGPETLYVTQQARSGIKAQQWICDFSGHLIPQIMGHLHGLGIKSIIVEGGAELLQSFIRAGLWDEARVLVARGRYLGSGIPAPSLGEALPLSRQSIGSDELLLFRKPTHTPTSQS